MQPPRPLICPDVINRIPAMVESGVIAAANRDVACADYRVSCCTLPAIILQKSYHRCKKGCVLVLRVVGRVVSFAVVVGSRFRPFWLYAASLRWMLQGTLWTAAPLRWKISLFLVRLPFWSVGLCPFLIQ